MPQQCNCRRYSLSVDCRPSGTFPLQGQAARCSTSHVVPLNFCFGVRGRGSEGSFCAKKRARRSDLLDPPESNDPISAKLSAEFRVLRSDIVPSAHGRHGARISIPVDSRKENTIGKKKVGASKNVQFVPTARRQADSIRRGWARCAATARQFAILGHTQPWAGQLRASPRSSASSESGRSVAGRNVCCQ